jgi:ribosomal protein S27AE
LNHKKGLRRTYCSNCGQGLGYFMVNTPLESKMLIQFMEEKRWYCIKCRETLSMENIEE